MLVHRQKLPSLQMSYFHAIRIERGRLNTAEDAIDLMFRLIQSQHPKQFSIATRKRIENQIAALSCERHCCALPGAPPLMCLHGSLDFARYKFS